MKYGIGRFGRREYRRASQLEIPLLMHFAELDSSVPPYAYRQVSEALSGRAEIHLYTGAGHGVGRFGYPPFHEEAAGLALERLLTFLQEHLG